MVPAYGLKQFTQCFYFQGCLAPIKVLIPPGSILQPSQDAAVVGGNVLTSQRVVDVIFRAFEVCAASQVRDLEKMQYVSSLRRLYSFFWYFLSWLFYRAAWTTSHSEMTPLVIMRRLLVEQAQDQCGMEGVVFTVTWPTLASLTQRFWKNGQTCLIKWILSFDYC